MNRTLTIMAAAAIATACGGRTDVEKPAAAAADTPVYVDVRSAEEFAAGHVIGALNIPHDQMDVRYTELEKYRNQPIILYCRSGRRSDSALVVLKSKGFTNVENGGGIDGINRPKTSTR
ncbi:MAG TPA: rhodanese-like domain-containing protein [Longimicrobiales bacterium]